MPADDSHATVSSEKGAMPWLKHSPLFVGMRYLLKKKLSYLAIVGVAVSVGTLIVVMGVMSGFEKQLRSVIRGYLSDMTLLPLDGGLYGLEDWEQQRERVLGTQHVAAVAPYVEGPGLMRVGRSRQMEHVFFRAMHPELEPEVTLFGGEFIQGGDLHCLNNVYYDENEAELHACLIGSEMAKQWSVYYQLCEFFSDKLPEGDYERLVGLMDEARRAETLDEARRRMGQAVAYLAPRAPHLAEVLRQNGERALRDEIILVTATGDARLERRLRKYVVAGVFNTGRFDYDSSVVLLSLDSAIDFVASGGRVTGLNVKLDDYANAPKVRAALQGQFIVRTWEDQQRTFLEAVAMERFLMALILCFLGVLAGFCIFAILIMTVYEKRRDIGILKAVGFTSGDVATTFLVDGGAIGVMGALVGTLGGLLFAFNINEIAAFVEKLTGWTPFPRDVYYFTRIPVDKGLLMPLCISAGAILLSLTFSIVPALKAARLDPVQTLRFE